MLVYNPRHVCLGYSAPSNKMAKPHGKGENDKEEVSELGHLASSSFFPGPSRSLLFAIRTP